ERPLTAKSLYDLAEFYYERRRYAEAEPLLKRALEIREETLGKDHYDTYRVLSTLAIVYLFQNRYAETEPLYLRMLEFREKTGGKEIWRVMIIVNTLAEL